MGLKKTFPDTTRYYYAVIDRLNLGKNTKGSVSGTNHIIEVNLFLKDSDDPEFSVFENPLIFRVPTIKQMQVPNMDTVPKIDKKTGEQETDKKGKPVLEEVQNGFKNEVDKSYRDPFLISNMSADGKDPLRLAYDWLKENILLFSEFFDVFESGQK